MILYVRDRKPTTKEFHTANGPIDSSISLIFFDTSLRDFWKLKTTSNYGEDFFFILVLTYTAENCLLSGVDHVPEFSTARLDLARYGCGPRKAKRLRTSMHKQ